MMKESTGERIFRIIIISMITLASLSCLLPIMNVFSIAFSESSAVESGHVMFFPVGFTTKSFELLIKGTTALQATQNSIIVTIFGTIISMVLTICAAYPLSKSYFVWRNFFTKSIVFTMLFNGGMIPTYIIIQKYGMIDSYWSLWLTTSISTYNMFVLRTFFHNVPKELEEAAVMDGCGEFRQLFQIFLPLSKPVLATLVLFYGVGYWNIFMSALLYINNPNKQVLSVLVQTMIKSMDILKNEIANANPQDILAITSTGIRSSGVVIMILPMIVVYPFLQKYFVKGIMLGSVKG